MIKWTYKQIKLFRWKYIFYIGCIIVYTLISLLTPIIGKYIIDILIPNKQLKMLVGISCVWLVVECFRNSINIISENIYNFLKINCSYNIQQKIIETMQHTPWSFLVKQDMLYLSTRIYNDSNIVTEFVLGLTGNILSKLLMTIVAIGILIYIAGGLGIFLLAVIIIYVYVRYLYQKKLYNVIQKDRENQDTFLAEFLAQFLNMKFVQQYEIAKELIRKLNEKFQKYEKNSIDVQKTYSVFDGIDEMISSIGRVIIYLFGGYCIVMHKITIGEFVIVIDYFQMILGSIQEFTELDKKYKESKVSYARIKELLNKKEQENGIQYCPKVNRIACDRVFYKVNNQMIIQNFSYKFKRGNIYCIWGENGSGKTTLLDILLGLYNDKIDGKIKYNDIDINYLDMRKMRREQISFVEQEPYLIQGSIENNVFLTEHYSRRSLKNVIEKLKFDAIDTMMKEERKIIDGKSEFSGGERQKIALVRLFIKTADVLLLDEPTSALDVMSKKRVMDYLQDIKQDKIIIIISHDWEIAELCDKVVKI